MAINFDLKRARMEKGIPAWRLAQEVGISAQRLSYIELGRAQATNELKRKIAKVLGKRVEDLFNIHSFRETN